VLPRPRGLIVLGEKALVLPARARDMAREAQIRVIIVDVNVVMRYLYNVIRWEASTQ